MQKHAFVDQYALQAGAHSIALVTASYRSQCHNILIDSGWAKPKIDLTPELIPKLQSCPSQTSTEEPKQQWPNTQSLKPYFHASCYWFTGRNRSVLEKWEITRESGIIIRAAKHKSPPTVVQLLKQILLSSGHP